LNPAPICASRFWIDTKSKLDAGADGYNVRITEALVSFAANDDELAAAVAHELSHNLLEHREKLRRMRKSAGNIRATEIEADRLSVWLMANAGYDPSAAVRFIERFRSGYRSRADFGRNASALAWSCRHNAIRNQQDKWLYEV
jgi:predicted Zn-dependent protease